VTELILTPSVDDPSLILVSELSVKQAQEVELFRQRYGDRDLFALGNVVCRPDGSLFIQGALSTYTETELEPDPQFVSWSGIRFPGVAVSERTGSVADDVSFVQRHHSTILGYAKGGRPGAQDNAVPHTPIPSLTVYRDKWVERTYEVPGGQVTLRRLRAAKEGRGM